MRAWSAGQATIVLWWPPFHHTELENGQAVFGREPTHSNLDSRGPAQRPKVQLVIRWLDPMPLCKVCNWTHLPSLQGPGFFSATKAKSSAHVPTPLALKEQVRHVRPCVIKGNILPTHGPPSEKAAPGVIHAYANWLCRGGGGADEDCSKLQDTTDATHRFARVAQSGVHPPKGRWALGPPKQDHDANLSQRQYAMSRPTSCHAGSAPIHRQCDTLRVLRTRPTLLRMPSEHLGVANLNPGPGQRPCNTTGTKHPKRT